MHTEHFVATRARVPEISGEGGKALQRCIRGVIPQFTDAALQFGELSDRRQIGRIVYTAADGGVVHPFSWFMRGFLEATGKNTIPWMNVQTQRRDEADSSSTAFSVSELAGRIKADPMWPGPYDWGQQRVAVVTPTITSGETVNTVTRAIRLAMREDNGRIRAHPAIDVITTQFNGLDRMPSYEWDTVDHNRERTIIDLEHRGIPLGSGGRVYAPEQVDSGDPMDQLVRLLTPERSGSLLANPGVTAVGYDTLPLQFASAALYSAGIAAGRVYETHDLEHMLVAAKQAIEPNP